MGCFTQKRCSPELALTLRLPLSRSLSFSPSFPYKLVSQVSKPLLRPTKCHLYCLLSLIGCCLVPQPAAAAPQTFLQGLSPWPGFLHRAGGYLISRTSAPPRPTPILPFNVKKTPVCCCHGAESRSLLQSLASGVFEWADFIAPCQACHGLCLPAHLNNASDYRGTGGCVCKLGPPASLTADPRAHCPFPSPKPSRTDVTVLLSFFRIDLLSRTLAQQPLFACLPLMPSRGC